MFNSLTLVMLAPFFWLDEARLKVVLWKILNSKPESYISSSFLSWMVGIKKRTLNRKQKPKSQKDRYCDLLLRCLKILLRSDSRAMFCLVLCLWVESKWMIKLTVEWVFKIKVKELKKECLGHVKNERLIKQMNTESLKEQR